MKPRQWPQRLDAFAAPTTNGSAAREKKRNIAAKLGGNFCKFAYWPVQGPTTIRESKRSRRACSPPAIVPAEVHLDTLCGIEAPYCVLRLAAPRLSSASSPSDSLDVDDSFVRQWSAMLSTRRVGAETLPA